MFELIGARLHSYLGRKDELKHIQLKYIDFGACKRKWCHVGTAIYSQAHFFERCPVEGKDGEEHAMGADYFSLSMVLVMLMRRATGCQLELTSLFRSKSNSLADATNVKKGARALGFNWLRIAESNRPSWIQWLLHHEVHMCSKELHTRLCEPISSWRAAYNVVENGLSKCDMQLTEKFLSPSTQLH